MPAQQCLRRHDCGNLRQHLSPKSSGFGRQTPALVIVEAQPSFAELFTKNSVLFTQVLDHVQLALIHPSGKRDQEKTELIEGCRHVVAFIIDPRSPAPAMRFRFSGHTRSSTHASASSSPCTCFRQEPWMILRSVSCSGGSEKLGS